MYGFIYQRRILAVISLCFLIFTKEPALLLYISLVSSYCFIAVAQTSFNRENKPFLVYFFPLILFILYYAAQRIFNISSGIWSNQNGLNLSFSLLWRGRILTRLVQLFILNFHWLYALIVLFGLFKFIKTFASFDVSLITKSFRKLKLPQQWVLILLFCFIVYAFPITLINTYTLPRYLVPLVPLLILFSLVSLPTLVQTARVRLVCLGILFILSFWQTFVNH